MQFRDVYLCVMDQVEWEFWTNSNDMCGAVCDVQKEFIKVRLPCRALAAASPPCTCWFLLNSKAQERFLKRSSLMVHGDMLHCCQDMLLRRHRDTDSRRMFAWATGSLRGRHMCILAASV